MAGIAGILGEKADRNIVDKMLQSLSHRGDAVSRIHLQSGLCAGVTSANLSAARGYGFAEDDGSAVFFDGDVYNLRSDGVSDADVALGLYRQFGRAFPGHLEGVFACAVFDDGELILARDGVGVRPLYFGKMADGSLCFASEMKALLGAAEEFFELHPKTTWSSECGVSGYVQHYPQVAMPAGFEDAAALVRDTVMDAVRRRLKDGAVGACLLSGGLDSSIIAAAANEIRPGLPAVTVGVKGAPDLENARLMAEHIGVEHRVSIYGRDDIVEAVPRAVRALESFDEDCVSGAISNLFASALAKNDTDCILSGEGGDELFGGYHLLKNLATEYERLEMMETLIDIAYNTAVQRLDRAMMANGTHYRTPFIDSGVVSLALQLPVRWKIHPNNGRFVEKYILREAFRDLLPEKIYTREKLRFSAGTGTDGLMDQIARGHVGAEDFTEEKRRTREGYLLSSPKEMWYYRLFKEHFPSPSAERLVGRWDPGK